MCDCIEKINDNFLEYGNLAAKNTRVALSINFSQPENSINTNLMIVTEKINPNLRIKPVVLFASYCPFCGEKYPERKT